MNGSFAFIFYISLVMSIPLIVFLHELGHSLFALLYTKQEVKMFIGSYGKTTDNYHFKIKRLHIYVERKFFKWRSGLCVSYPMHKWHQQLIQILAGPVFPFLIAIIFLAVANISFNEYWISTAIFFLIFCSVSLLENLIPRKKPIDLYNGGQTFNDGKLILLAMKNFSFSEEYNIAAKHYNNKNYSKAFIHFNNVITKYQLKDKNAYLYCLYALHMIRDIDRMKHFVALSEKRVSYNADELSNIGVYFSRLGNPEIAMEYYEKSLAVTENANALNNMGYSLNLLEKYNEALPYFDKAIAIEPDQAYSYNNRGYSKLKLGFREEGFEDFQVSYKLDPNNSYYYKNLGLYHFSKNEYKTALELFTKAKEMDADTYKIDDDIEMVKAYINP